MTVGAINHYNHCSWVENGRPRLIRLLMSVSSSMNSESQWFRSYLSDRSLQVAYRGVVHRAICSSGFSRTRHCYSKWARSFAHRHDIDRPQSGEPRDHCLLSVLLMASPAEKSPTLSGCRINENYCTCFRDITCGLPYCNTALVGSPKSVIDKPQHVLNAAARIVTGTRKFNRWLHADLHWLDVSERVPA